MTKKDFEFIANVLNTVKPSNSDPGFATRQWTKTISAFSKALAQQNPAFKLGKFERACETGEHIRKSIKEGE